MSESGEDAANISEEEEVQEVPKLRPYGNAGVKGVLYDYKEAREHAEKRMRERVEAARREMYGIKEPTEGVNEDVGDDLDELEREMFGEVVSEQVFKSRHRPELMKKVAKRTYGDVVELDDEEYVNVITTLEDDVFALIHIYTSFVRDCITINRMMEEYSKKYPNVCFARITWEDSNKPFPETALPALLLYQGDVIVKSLFADEALPFMRDIFPGLMDTY